MCTENERLNGFLEKLERYVNMETPSKDKEHLDRFSAALREEFLAAGCEVITHQREGGNILECRLGCGEKTILLLGHMDTVFPLGTVEKRPFTREGDILRGPGVLDMKSGVLMILEIMKAFRGTLPEGWSLVGLLNSDEEIGSGESRELILERGRAAAYCLCMEPSKPDCCTVARKGLATYTIETAGVSAHSGVNYAMGHSAIQALCRIVEQLYTLRDDEKGNSVNVGGIQGGVWKGNIVADKAKLIGEVRFYRPEDGDEMLEQIRHMAENTGDPQVTGTYTLLSRRPPMPQTEGSRLLYEKAKKAAEANGLTLAPRTHGGGSDGSFVASVGTPVVDGMGAEGQFSHTEEEYVKADTLMQRLDMCIQLIGELMQDK